MTRACPNCGCSKMYELTSGGGGAMNGICANCRAYLNNTPFGVKVLYDDAAKIRPEIIEWWDKRDIEGLDGDKSKRK